MRWIGILGLALCLNVLVVAAQDEPAWPSPASFLKDMEQYASDLGGREAKWVKKSFGPRFSALETGRQGQVMSLVDALQETRQPFAESIWGYLKGVDVLLQRPDDDAWKGWHRHVTFFASSTKHRQRAKVYLANSESLLKQGKLHGANTGTWLVRGGRMAFDLDDENRPRISCDSSIVICLAKGDSAKLHQVRGQYDVLENEFRVETGRLNWERTVREGDFQAEVRAFNIRLKGSTFTTDSATFQSDMFETPLHGTLHFKVQAEKQAKKRTYPRFESSAGRIVLDSVFHGVSYEGGLAVRGSKMSGMGSDGLPAEITFSQADSVLVVCRSQEVLFSEDGLDAVHAALVMRLGEDSLTHEDISIRYLDKKRLFRATRQVDGVGMQPFVDGYHGIEVEAEAVEWRLDGPVVEFRRLAGGGAEAGAFRSLDCFEKDVYDQMMGIDPIHPLAELSRYTKRRGVDSFYASEYADFLGLQTEQAEMILVGLTNVGYVDLDLATGFCQVKPRAVKHMLCQKGACDHDVLAFYSRPRGTVYATLSLNNLRMSLKGIGQIAVSEAQDVQIVPDGGEIALGEDRDFAFSGLVKAGKFQLKGSDFEFDYASFKIEVRQAESLRIMVEQPGKYDTYGRPALRPVASSIEELTGTLEIDNPRNKSGWRSASHPQYPILTSREVSHVYYDAPRIWGGAYHRDRFNYAVDPFVIDSLDNFANEDLLFTGELLAGDILPDVVEPLRLMDDYSLGFTTTVASGGTALYGGVGKLSGELSLDLGGLHGPGRVTFLTSTMDSEDHVLLPDSTFGESARYDNMSTAGLTPKVSAEDASYGLHPFDQRLDVRSTALDSLRFFGEPVDLEGGLSLKGDQMTARGTFHFDRAELSSRHFEVEHRGMRASESAFQLHGLDQNELAFETDRVSSVMDFDARSGDFISLEGATLIELPAIRYTCSMDAFTWFMDEARLELRNTMADPASKTFQELRRYDQSNFFSQAAGQDSLHFLSPAAQYAVDEAHLTCQEVVALPIADAQIKPYDGLVSIRRDALMDLLEQAEVEVDNLTHIHRLYDAKIQVNGRMDYEGAGTGTYVDQDGEEWPVRFNELTVDSAKKTLGHGFIRSADEFELSPKFAFQGRVHLEAMREHLEFEGGAKMDLECEGYPAQWVEFKGVIDPMNVAIPVDSMVTEMGKSQLGVGWAYSDGGLTSLYPTFFSPKPVRSDMSFMTPRGLLRFDPKRSRYIVSSDEKLMDETLPGNLMSMSPGSCDLRQHGVGHFPIEEKHLLKHAFFGEGLVQSDRMVVKGGLTLDMPLPEEVVDHLAEAIRGSEASGLAWSGTQYPYMLNEWLGEEKGNALLVELNMNRSFKKQVPEEVQHTMVLHGLELEYDKFEDQWISMGDIGVATLGKHEVWRTFRGKVALDWDDQIIHIYFHLSGQQWYYMEWNAKLGYFRIHPKDPKLDEGEPLSEKIQGLKEGDKRVKEDRGQFVLQLLNPNSRNRRDFVDMFREFDD